MELNGGGASSRVAMVCPHYAYLIRVLTIFIAGKGMHDGAGAWIKSSVARACLAGVGILSVEDFFHYCIMFLNANISNKNFTSERNFYLLAVASVAMYRASMPSTVTGKLRILQTKTGSSSIWVPTD